MTQYRIKRETCEICDHDRLSQCRACDLSGDPNPEAFSRQELVDALIEKYRKEEQKSRPNTKDQVSCSG